MKRISITKGFLVVIIIFAMIIGGAFAFVLINPNAIGLTSLGDQVTISSDDYNYLIGLSERYKKVEEVRSDISTEFYTDFDEEKLDEGMIKGMVAGLGDIYSSYYTAEEYEDIQASLIGEYSGVGITMTESDGYIKIIKVNKNSPAAKAGVKIGDYIVGVDGTAYSSTEMDIAAAAIRGEKGKEVTVTLLRDGDLIDVTMKRAKIVTETIEYKMLDDNIGYIYISGFESGTYDDFKAALKELSASSGLIIDLRDNPGGLVNSACDIADLFMDKATLIYTEDRNGSREYMTTKNGKEYDNPIVILQNANSASSSEIFAGGMQDNNVATIVGTQSFGKGIIQSLSQYEEKDALKITVWQYFTPSGKAIHNKGITPDVLSELVDPEYDADGNLINDTQLEDAISTLKSLAF